MTEKEKLLAWCLGNQSAADMLWMLAEVSQIADDFVDGDTNESERMIAMLHMAMIELPLNRFYQVNFTWIAPMLINAMLHWDLSNELKESNLETSRHFGYVLRESLEQIIVLVADIIGGVSHGRLVARDVHRYFHVDSPQETLKEWSGESKLRGGSANG